MPGALHCTWPASLWRWRRCGRDAATCINSAHSAAASRVAAHMYCIHSQCSCWFPGLAIDCMRSARVALLCCGPEDCVPEDCAPEDLKCEMLWLWQQSADLSAALMCSVCGAHCSQCSCLFCAQPATLLCWRRIAGSACNAVMLVPECRHCSTLHVQRACGRCVLSTGQSASCLLCSVAMVVAICWSCDHLRTLRMCNCCILCPRALVLCSVQSCNTGGGVEVLQQQHAQRSLRCCNSNGVCTGPVCSAALLLLCAGVKAVCMRTNCTAVAVPATSG